MGIEFSCNDDCIKSCDTNQLNRIKIRDFVNLDELEKF